MNDDGMTKRIKLNRVRHTGLTYDCDICGATDVPMDWSIRLFWHAEGEPYVWAAPGTCRGGDLFTRLLTDAGLAVEV